MQRNPTLQRFTKDHISNQDGIVESLFEDTQDDATDLLEILRVGRFDSALRNQLNFNRITDSKLGFPNSRIRRFRFCHLLSRQLVQQIGRSLARRLELGVIAEPRSRSMMQVWHVFQIDLIAVGGKERRTGCLLLHSIQRWSASWSY
jgi:hypothetical protein